MNLDLWTCLAVIALVGLIIFYKKGAAWGGLTLGVIVGCAISLVRMAGGDLFNVTTVKIAAIIGALLGVIISLVLRVKHQRKHKEHEKGKVRDLH